MDQLNQMAGLSAMVDEKLRAFGAAGLSYSCPDLQAAGADGFGMDLEVPTGWGKWGVKVKSGRDAKLVDNVIKTLKWPHAQLDFAYYCTFDKLDFPLLVAGELSTIGSDISQEERAGRVELLLAVAYHSKSYQWPAVRDFYASVLQAIERGQRSWGTRENYRFFEAGLYRFPLAADSGVRQSAKFSKSAPENRGETGKRFYCMQYQRNQCTHSEAHEGLLGRSKSKVLLEHFCRACFEGRGAFEKHPDSDKGCPSQSR